MSTVTEAEVLDVLLCWWAVFGVVNPRGARRDRHPEGWSTEIRMAAWEVALERLDACDDSPDGYLYAIADSERRLEVERARDAVVRAVAIWDPNGFIAPRPVMDALASLRAAEAEVFRHGG